MKTRSLKQRRGKKTRRGGGLFSSAKVAPLPALPNAGTERKIGSKFDIFIDKFIGSIKDETGKNSAEDINAYYESQPEYEAIDTKLKWPYSGKQFKITYRQSEEYSVKHDSSVCDIKALCDYIAVKRIRVSKLPLSKDKISNGAAYIIKSILEKIGTDVTTDSVRRFLLEYIWKDTPVVKRDFQLLNSSNTRRNASKSVKDILTGMLCVRVLIKKKFNEVGYRSEDLDDDFSGTNSSLFNNAPIAPSAPWAPSAPTTVTPPPGFIRRCINGICSIFRRPATITRTNRGPKEGPWYPSPNTRRRNR
jgi:hypothetical protein